MHVLLEEAIEVLHQSVSEHCSYGANFGWGIYAEQPQREPKTGLNLELCHGHLVFNRKGPLQSSHLHA